MRFRSAISIAVVAAMLSPHAARAQDRKAEAESLFEEGRSLVAKKSFGEACPKFAESYRLEPGLGTLLNLASCEEQLGKTATAWARYREALAVATRANDAKRIKFAKEHAEYLEKKLSRLTVVVPEANRIAGLEVKRDGQSLGEASWGSALAVDPGAHVIEARAEGRQPFTTTVTLAADADQKTVSVPLLEPGAASTRASTTTPAVAPPPRPLPSKKDEGGIDARSVIGWTAIGTGGLALIGGSIAGIVAISIDDDAKSHCPTNTTCDREGVELTQQAQDASVGSTLGFISGAVLVAAGLGVFLLWPKASATPKASIVGLRF